jgi:hypothetical protein
MCVSYTCVVRRVHPVKLQKNGLPNHRWFLSCPGRHLSKRQHHLRRPPLDPLYVSSQMLFRPSSRRMRLRWLAFCVMSTQPSMRAVQRAGTSSSGSATLARQSRKHSNGERISQPSVKSTTAGRLWHGVIGTGSRSGTGS